MTRILPRILHVLDHSLPVHSGYTFRTRAIMHAQAASGLDVAGITGLRHPEPGPREEEVDGLAFHRTTGIAKGPPGLREWREIGALARAIERVARDWKPDVLHAHSPALNGLAAIRAGRTLGIPVVYEIRAFWEDAAVENGAGRDQSLKYRLTRELENRAVAGADAVFTICKGLREDLVARGHNGGKIGIMPNGVDLALFGEAAPRDDALAEELGLGEGPVIAFIGSFYPYEGIDDLIAAMPALVDAHPDAKLLLVGGGQEEAALKAQAAASSASGSIVFTGRVPHGKVPRYYALADIMAYPRKASRLTELVTPLKPLEAMAQDKLVAASDIGGHRELMTDGETGVLFAPDDPAALAASLAALIDRKDSWPAIRAAAKRHVAERHDWARNSQRYQDVYQALLAPRPNSGVASAAA